MLTKKLTKGSKETEYNSRISGTKNKEPKIASLLGYKHLLPE